MNIAERLNQICEYQLPYNFCMGNILPYRETQLAGVLSDGIPEVIVLDFHDRALVRQLSKRFYAPIMARAGNVDEYLFEEGEGEYINSQLLEVHALYCPSSDITHCFALPSREFID